MNALPTVTLPYLNCCFERASSGTFWRCHLDLQLSRQRWRFYWATGRCNNGNVALFHFRRNITYAGTSGGNRSGAVCHDLYRCSYSCGGRRLRISQKLWILLGRMCCERNDGGIGTDLDGLAVTHGEGRSHYRCRWLRLYHLSLTRSSANTLVFIQLLLFSVIAFQRTASSWIKKRKNIVIADDKGGEIYDKRTVIFGALDNRYA